MIDHPNDAIKGLVLPSINTITFVVAALRAADDCLLFVRSQSGRYKDLTMDFRCLLSF